jgi:hypothetical protein
LSGPWTAIYTNPPPTAITNSLTISNTPGLARYFRIQAGP